MHYYFKTHECSLGRFSTQFKTKDKSYVNQVSGKLKSTPLYSSEFWECAKKGSLFLTYVIIEQTAPRWKRDAVLPATQAALILTHSTPSSCARNTYINNSLFYSCSLHIATSDNFEVEANGQSSLKVKNLKAFGTFFYVKSS